MELFIILLIAFIVFVFIKTAGFLIHAGAFVITLPFKLLSVILTIAFLAVLIVPAALIIAFLPVILIILGVWLLSKN